MDSQTSEPPDIRGIAQDLKDALAELEAHEIRRMRDFAWQPSFGVLELVARCAVIRQHDGLLAIAELVLAKRGDAADAMLRPACEEYIALKYFGSLPREDAKALAMIYGQRDVLLALQAQAGYSGANLMSALGLDGFLDAADAGSPEWQGKLAEFRGKHKWKKELPSVSFIAKGVGEQALYSLLYHATSRSVHFNVGELLRRAWGKPGSMEIRSNQFEPYRATFAISWGWRLYTTTRQMLQQSGLITMVDKSPDETSRSRVNELAQRITALGEVPIITARELKWVYPRS